MTDIDTLSPALRIEIQEFYLLCDTKRRDFRDSGRPNRRHPPRVAPTPEPPARRSFRDWPQRTWHVNDREYVYLKRMAAIPD